MKRNYISIIFAIFGILAIVAGITLTVIPLFDFDVFTFNLGKSMVTALVFPFIGIVLITFSVILHIMGKSTDKMASINDIAKSVKGDLENKANNNKPKKCKYCGGLVEIDKPCPNCGAVYKTKIKTDKENK